MNKVSEKKAKTVSLRLSDNMYKIIEKFSEHKKKSISEWIRDIISFYIYPVYLEALLEQKVVVDKPEYLVYLGVKLFQYDNKVIEIENLLNDYDVKFKKIKEIIQFQSKKVKKLTNQLDKQILKKVGDMK